MKLLIDVNLTPRWTAWFGEHGFDAVHWSEVGPLNAPNSEIMAYALARDCVVFTHDLDFSAILAATHAQKPSVIQVRGADVRPETIGETLLKALQQMAGEIAEGALLTVDIKQARIRVLPLRPTN